MAAASGATAACAAGDALFAECNESVTAFVGCVQAAAVRGVAVPVRARAALARSMVDLLDDASGVEFVGATPAAASNSRALAARAVDASSSSSTNCQYCVKAARGGQVGRVRAVRAVVQVVPGADRSKPGGAAGVRGGDQVGQDEPGEAVCETVTDIDAVASTAVATVCAKVGLCAATTMASAAPMAEAQRAARFSAIVRGVRGMASTHDRCGAEQV